MARRATADAVIVLVGLLLGMLIMVPARTEPCPAEALRLWEEQQAMLDALYAEVPRITQQLRAFNLQMRRFEP